MVDLPNNNPAKRTKKGFFFFLLEAWTYPSWTWEVLVSIKTAFIELIISVAKIESGEWNLFSSKNFHLSLLPEKILGPGLICPHKNRSSKFL